MSERLDDGHQTLISFGADPTVLFWEKKVTPPSIVGGGEINTTTMHNTTYRTKKPKALKDVGNSSVTVAYDPACYPEILALVNVNNLITITWPDGDTLSYWGWLDEFTPGELVEGEQPEAEITIIASNQNESNVETGPAHAV